VSEVLAGLPDEPRVERLGRWFQGSEPAFTG
jgi:hypothetical protein